MEIMNKMSDEAKSVCITKPTTTTANKEAK
jgi:hypothetical protein